MGIDSKVRCRLQAVLARVPLRGEGSCGVGRASRDSAGSGATEEGLTSRGGRNLRLPLRFGSDHRVPAELGQESQASSCVEDWNSA